VSRTSADLRLECAAKYGVDVVSGVNTVRLICGAMTCVASLSDSLKEFWLAPLLETIHVLFSDMVQTTHRIIAVYDKDTVN
jgi:hypothetical protein